MSKSRRWMMLIGLATFMFAPINITPQTIVDGFMEADIQTRTKEVKLIDAVEEVEFVSAHQEEIIEVEEEVSEWVEVNCELTFYTDLASCNGSNAGKNAIGGKLSSTSIAIPRKSMPFGTKIDLGKYGIRYADDVGSPKYIRIKNDGTYVFDVFMPRVKGENDKQYKDRIMSMGRIKTTAKIYIKE